MTTQIKRRRGTTTEHSTFTGAEGEITIDTTKDTAVVHDGATAGGHPLAKEDGSTLTNVNIDSGTIDGVTIGGASAGAGTFTNLTATGTTTLAGATTSADITFGDNDKAIFGAGPDLQIYHAGSNSFVQDVGTGSLLLCGNNLALKNGDNTESYIVCANNGATTIYHDNAPKLATTATGINVTGTVTFNGGTTSADLNFGDNDKAVFGAGSDLQIYHDGSHSYIKDAGTGQLRILATDLRINNTTNDKSYITGTDGAELTLYHNGSGKLTTTSTGIDVTGTVTADGLTVDGNAEINNTAITLDLMESDTTDLNSRIQSQNGEFRINTLNDAKTAQFIRFDVDHATGDISFYEDTGTTPKLFWDASAERLGIGTTSPAQQLHIKGDDTATGYSAPGITIEQDGTGDASINFLMTGVRRWLLGVDNSDSDKFKIAGANQLDFTDPAITIASSGFVGINVSNPTDFLHVAGADGSSGSASVSTNTVAVFQNDGAVSDSAIINIIGGSSSDAQLSFGDTANGNIGAVRYENDNDAMAFITNASEAMRIDSSGNVGIGTTTVGQKLVVSRLGGQPVAIPSLDANTAALFHSGNGATGSGAALALLGGNASACSLTFADTDNGYAGRISYSHSADAMIFRVNNAERMRIDSSGNLLVDLSAQTYSSRLEVSHSGLDGITTIFNGTAGNNAMKFRNANGQVGAIVTSGSTTSYNESSDYRLKENVVDMTDAIDRVKALPVRRFNFIADPDTTVDGFLAHEAQEVVPEAVTGEKDAVDEDGNIEIQQIDKSKLVPLLTGALKEAIARIETLEAEVTALKGA